MGNQYSDFAILIVAGGTGRRMGADRPKQYLPLLGQAVLAHAVRAFAAFAPRVYVAHPPEHERLCTESLAGIEGFTLLPAGGATRQETVRRALALIAPQAPRYILVHDAARPCVSADVIAGVMQALKGGALAAAPAVAVPDTLRRLTPGKAAEDVERSHVHAVQTPQGFVFKDLAVLHDQAGAVAGDDAGLFATAGHVVCYTQGCRNNLKITEAGDLDDAAAILAARLGDIRSAGGYDVHAFVDATPARPLRLGGVTIAHDKTLEGHSDADALLHAITDALLGCIAAGDIGHHFSPKDARWKDADSAAFLAHARDMVAARGGAISHIDATIICEEPKISPHRAAMQARIAEILRLNPARVSIKATTSERLGFTGRGEGLAAQATATVRLPFSTTCTEKNAHAA